MNYNSTLNFIPIWLIFVHIFINKGEKSDFQINQYYEIIIDYSVNGNRMIIDQLSINRDCSPITT